MEIILHLIYIFCARMTDVTLGSLRIIFIGKGRPFHAFIIAIIEVSIWFLVAKDVLNGGVWYDVFPYAIGYATGTFIGIKVNEVFVSGNLGLQVVTTTNDMDIVKTIRDHGYAVSIVDVRGMDKRKKKFMLFIEIDKHKYEEINSLIKEIDPGAFITVHETRFVTNGFFK